MLNLICSDANIVLTKIVINSKDCTFNANKRLITLYDVSRLSLNNLSFNFLKWCNGWRILQFSSGNFIQNCLQMSEFKMCRYWNLELSGCELAAFESWTIQSYVQTFITSCKKAMQQRGHSKTTLTIFCPILTTSGWHVY